MAIPLIDIPAMSIKLRDNFPAKPRTNTTSPVTGEFLGGCYGSAALVLQLAERDGDMTPCFLHGLFWRDGVMKHVLDSYGRK
jgi:hypothetical protein